MHYTRLSFFLCLLNTGCTQATDLGTKALSDQSNPICLQELSPQTDPLCPNGFTIKTDYQHNVDYCCEAAVVLPGGEDSEGSGSGKSRLCVAATECPVLYELTPGISGADCYLNNCAAAGYGTDPLTGECSGCSCTEQSIPLQNLYESPICPSTHNGLALAGYTIDESPIGSSVDECLYENISNPGIVHVPVSDEMCSKGSLIPIAGRDICSETNPPLCPQEMILQPDATCTSCEDLCTSVDYLLTNNPPQILIALDKSESMGPGHSLNPTHWTIARRAVEDLICANDTFDFGLLLFPFGSSEPLCGIGQVAVPVGSPDPKIPILAALSDATPSGHTPLTKALDVAYHGQTFTTSVPRKAVVLLTDGNDTCEGSETATVILTRDAYRSQGIQTFVIKLGPSEQFLDEIAQKGGTGSAYLADDAEKILEALEQTLTIASCSFDIPATVSSNPSLQVFIDGQPVPESAWILVSNHVIVEDEWCNAITSGSAQSVTVRADCASNIAP